jgi:hypothetical protein
MKSVTRLSVSSPAWKVWLGRLLVIGPLVIGFLGGFYGPVIWAAIDHRTPEQRVADDAKEAALLAEWDRQLIQLFEKDCGEISAKTIVEHGAYGCVEAVMDDFYGRNE